MENNPLQYVTLALKYDLERVNTTLRYFFKLSRIIVIHQSKSNLSIMVLQYITSKIAAASIAKL